MKIVKYNDAFDAVLNLTSDLNGINESTSYSYPCHVDYNKGSVPVTMAYMLSERELEVIKNTGMLFITQLTYRNGIREVYPAVCIPQTAIKIHGNDFYTMFDNVEKDLFEDLLKQKSKKINKEYSFFFEEIKTKEYQNLHDFINDSLIYEGIDDESRETSKFLLKKLML